MGDNDHGDDCTGCAPDPALAGRVTAPTGRTAAGPGPDDERPAPDRAELLVTGRIVTLDPGRPGARAMAVSGGRIIGLGSPEDLEGLVGVSTQLLDAGDSVVFPGFVEPHMHLWGTAVVDTWNCSTPVCPTFDSVMDLLADRAAAAPPGQWVLGKLFDPSLYDGEPELHRDLLDRVAPDNPVAVVNASLHFVYANSRALEASGLTDDTPDPPGGTFGRTDGRLNGVAGEMPAILAVMAGAPVAGADEYAATVAGITVRAARAGITRIHEAATGALFGPAEVDLLRGLADDGRLAVRVSAAVLSHAAPAFTEAGITPFSGDDRVRVTSCKIIADGSNQGRSGYLDDPYLGSSDRGAANLAPGELVGQIRAGHEAGWQVMVHANGDAAIAMTVDAYDEALAGASGLGLRHRIEHCSLATATDLRRMGRLGISPSFLMNHVYYWGAAFRDTILGGERAGRLDPARTALDAGLRISLHSDHSVTPLEPLRSAQTAVTRRTWRGDAELNGAERVTVGEALAAVTTDAAWQLHSEDDLGSLAVGKLADFCLLSADPTSTPGAELADITVAATYVGGRPVWTS